MCVPKLLYGLEACCINEDCLITMEKANRYCACKLQGFSPQTPIVVPLATLGLQSIESLLHCNKMVMLYRWLSLPSSCMYKKVVIARLVYHLTDTGSNTGALYDALQLCQHYGLDEHLVTALETGQTMPISKWKQIVRCAVRDNEQIRWKLTLHLYSSITLYRNCISSIRVSVWWHVCRCRPHLTKATRIVMKLLAGQHGLGVNVARFQNAPRNRDQLNTCASRACPLCDTDTPETVEHFLMACTRLNDTRQVMLDNLVLLPNTQMRFFSLNPYEKTVFLLSGMGGDFIWEWLDSYESIVTFVARMYTERHKLMSQP